MIKIGDFVDEWRNRGQVTIACRYTTEVTRINRTIGEMYRILLFVFF